MPVRFFGPAREKEATGITPKVLKIDLPPL
jgi:hypothetical protein